MAGTALVLFWAIMAIFAPLLSPCDPNATLMPLARPGTPLPTPDACWTDTFVLGTDNIGRDVLSRIVWGARTVLTWAPIAAVCAYAVGIVLGLAAGYYRGWIRRSAVGAVEHHPRVPGAGALHPDHRHHRSLAAQHRVRGDLRHRAAGDAHRARAGARPAQPGVRGGGGDSRRIGLAHHARRDPAECTGPVDRRRMPAARVRHHHHRRARLPRLGAAATGSGLGEG